MQRADPPGQPAAGVDRDRAVPFRPMRRLKNSTGVFVGHARCRCADVVWRAAEGEDALALEEEVALLGKEQTEARQVHLLLVVFDLREVGVDR